MAFTNPITWLVGQLVTAAAMNQQIRDNMSAIWQGLAAGDMDYYTGATTKTRIPIGTQGQALKVVAGVPAWSGSGIGCVINNGGAVSIPNDTLTTLTSFSAETYDSDLFHAGTSGTITIPAGLGGLYILGASGYWTDHADANLREIGLLINDAATAKISAPGVSGNSIWQNAVQCALLAAGNTVKLSVLQKSTVALNWNFYTLWAMKVA